MTFRRLYLRLYCQVPVEGMHHHILRYCCVHMGGCSCVLANNTVTT